MKKRFLVAVLTAAAFMLFFACSTGPDIQSAPASSEISGEESSLPADEGREEEASRQSASEEAVFANEESYAFVTAITPRADGQADITFDYAEWLSGEEARTAYREDNPDAAEQEMEDAGIFESGYIRNTDSKRCTYPTGDGTEYRLPGPDNIAENIPVGREEFQDRMTAALHNEESFDTFVYVRVEDGVIVSVEWLYRP